MNKKKIILIILSICIMLVFPFVTAPFTMGVKADGKADQNPKFRITTIRTNNSFLPFYLSNENNVVYIDKYVAGTDTIAGTMEVDANLRNIDVSFYNTDTTDIKTYDNNDNLIKVQSNSVRDSSGEYFTKYTYTYDTNGNLIEKISYWGDVVTADENGNRCIYEPQEQFVHVYEYNEQNKLITEYIDGNSIPYIYGHPISTATQQAYDDYVIFDTFEQNKCDGSFIKISHEYDNVGRLSRSLIYSSDTETKPYRYIEYAYPDTNTVQVRYVYAHSGTPYCGNTIIYYYDADQNLIRREDYSEDKLANHYTFEYDTNGYLIKEQHYSRNEWELTKTYEYTYSLY